jgi:hypothetical protein
MGTWGAGIFSNDTACDVQVAYRMALEDGLDDQAAQQHVLDQFADHLGDDTCNDGPLVWLALAKTQWQLGRLDEHVKAQALAIIDQGRDLATWQDSDLYGYRRGRAPPAPPPAHHPATATQADPPAPPRRPRGRPPPAALPARQRLSAAPVGWSQRPRAGQPARPRQRPDHRLLLRPRRPAAVGAAADPRGAWAASPPRAYRPLPRRRPAPAPLADPRSGAACRLGGLAAAAV